MTIRLTTQQAQRLLGTRSAQEATTGAPARRSRPYGQPDARICRPSKYQAKRTTVNGFTFASKAEARRYHQLLLRGLAGELRNLELQPRFPLCMADGTLIATYVGDFRYQEPRIPGSGADWRDVVEDVKGVRTAVYRLKRRLFEATYGRSIVFREVQERSR